MTNLHRDLAPISAAAWAEIEEEASRTFKRHVAGRRVVDVEGPSGDDLAAIPLGHQVPINPLADGVIAHARQSQPIIELRVPFTVSRQAIDDVERGAKDSDWQPVKDAAKQIAFAEDRAIFEGYPAASITGVRASGSNPELKLPIDAKDYPEAISQAITSLRLAGVNGPYSLLLNADAFTAINETSDHATPSASTCDASSTARSSGPRPSTALSCCRRVAVTTNCTSARTCPSAISRTMRTPSSCTSRNR